MLEDTSLAQQQVNPPIHDLKLDVNYNSYNVVAVSLLSLQL